MQNYYEILGVAKDASPQAIKRAYRKLAHKRHPDKKGGDSSAFHALALAYETLSDPDKRTTYDLSGATTRPQPPEPQPVDFNKTFKNFFGGRFTHTPSPNKAPEPKEKQQRAISTIAEEMLAEPTGSDRLKALCAEMNPVINQIGTVDTFPQIFVNHANEPALSKLFEHWAYARGDRLDKNVVRLLTQAVLALKPNHSPYLLLKGLSSLFGAHPDLLTPCREVLSIFAQYPSYNIAEALLNSWLDRHLFTQPDLNAVLSALSRTKNIEAIKKLCQAANRMMTRTPSLASSPSFFKIRTAEMKGSGMVPFLFAHGNRQEAADLFTKWISAQPDAFTFPDLTQLVEAFETNGVQTSFQTEAILKAFRVGLANDPHAITRIDIDKMEALCRQKGGLAQTELFPFLCRSSLSYFDPDRVTKAEFDAVLERYKRTDPLNDHDLFLSKRTMEQSYSLYRDKALRMIEEGKDLAAKVDPSDFLLRAPSSFPANDLAELYSAWLVRIPATRRRESLTKILPAIGNKASFAQALLPSMLTVLDDPAVAQEVDFFPMLKALPQPRFQNQLIDKVFDGPHPPDRKVLAATLFKSLLGTNGKLFLPLSRSPYLEMIEAKAPIAWREAVPASTLAAALLGQGSLGVEIVDKWVASSESPLTSDELTPFVEIFFTLPEEAPFYQIEAEFSKIEFLVGRNSKLASSIDWRKAPDHLLSDGAVKSFMRRHNLKHPRRIGLFIKRLIKKVFSFCP
ncbi:MAG: J domain-containing protein [Bdellovibrionales bacterium]